MWTSLPRSLMATAAAGRCARRTFLSEAYRSTDAWNARLQTPILQRIKPESFYYELDGKFQHQGKCSAIDIDIFANRLTDGSFADEVADLMHKLRLTAETTCTLPSTGHAVCRLYLEHVGDIHELLAILDNRMGYGVFLDTYTANLALDKLLRARDYTSAARIATFLMLQEDLGEEITRALALYACVKYSQAPQSFERPSIVDPDSAAAEAEAAAAAAAAEAAPKAAAAKKKKKEEVRVRVKFIRNEYFDDHFDLREPGHLVGKTLAAIGRQVAATDAGLGNSAQLLGLWQYGKHAEATALAKRVLNGGGRVHADVVQTIVGQVEAVAEPSAEVTALGEQLRALAGSAGLVAGDFEQAVCALANEAVQKNEATEIAAQAKVRVHSFK